MSGFAFHSEPVCVGPELPAGLSPVALADGSVVLVGAGQAAGLRRYVLADVDPWDVARCWAALDRPMRRRALDAMLGAQDARREAWEAFYRGDGPRPSELAAKLLRRSGERA